MPTPKRNPIDFTTSLRKKPHYKTTTHVLLLCILLTFPLAIIIKPASARTIYVPTEYTTIKAAVENAVTGDVIQVDDSKIYYENNIIVDSSITSLAIIGANPTTTIIDGMGNGTIFDVDGTHVNITGFTLRNAGSDHYAISSNKPGPSASNDYHRFTKNIITTSGYGISLGYSTRNTIYNNTFTNCPLGGMLLSNAGINNITRNSIKDSLYGIRIASSSTNTIQANTITQTEFGVHIVGSSTTASTGNIVKGNTIASVTAGVYSGSYTTTTNIDHNTIVEGSSAIYLLGTSATVNYNRIENTGLGISYGIRIWYSAYTTSNHLVTRNRIVNTGWAIESTYAIGDDFWANWVQNNTYGVMMSFSSTSIFYQNNFVDNEVQTAAGTGSNTWSSGGQGNYWSDYIGKDDNHDGIGDTPYLVSPIGQDNYPLMNTWSEHDVSIENITTNTTEVSVGQSINITVTVKNQGKLGTAETFQVTAKANGTAISTIPVSSLAAGATKNLSFIWNTTGQAAGNYTISATATTVTDELNTDNNNLNDGTVTIDVPILGDLDGNGTVNQQDLEILTQEYGTTLSDPYWNPNIDLNGDDIIDAHDLRILGKNYGKTA